jgi:hypothetical protein
MVVRDGFGERTLVRTCVWLACVVALSACSEENPDPAAMNPATGVGGTAGVPVAGMAVPIGGTPGATAGAGGTSTGVGGMVAVPMAGTGMSGAGGGAPNTGGTGGMQPMPGGSGDPGGTGGSTEVPDAGGPMPDAMVMEEDLGEGDGSDVITIGDSWMSLGFEGIQQSLVEASGNKPYRLYGVAGTRMLNGQIPGQYDRAKAADPDIKTVVMTGGGNDVLLTGLSGACASGSTACRSQLEMIAAEFDELWGKMAADGVRDVLLIHYADDAGDGLHESLMHYDRLMMHCGAVPSPLRCHLLFTTEIVMGQYRDGVHPTGPAYDRLGKAAYDLMVAEGMRR